MFAQVQECVFGFIHVSHSTVQQTKKHEISVCRVRTSKKG